MSTKKHPALCMAYMSTPTLCLAYMSTKHNAYTLPGHYVYKKEFVYKHCLYDLFEREGERGRERERESLWWFVPEGPSSDPKHAVVNMHL